MIINITYIYIIYVLWYRYSSALDVYSTLSHNRWAFCTVEDVRLFGWHQFCQQLNRVEVVDVAVWLGSLGPICWNTLKYDLLVLFCGCDWLSIWLSLGSGLWLFIFPQLLHSQFSGPEPSTEHPKPAMARGCNRDVHPNNGIYDCSITEPISNPCRYSFMSIFIR